LSGKLKRPLIADIAKNMSFEKIYADMAAHKIEEEVLSKDIQELIKKRNETRSKISRLNNIALAKRRAMVYKK